MKRSDFKEQVIPKEQVDAAVDGQGVVSEAGRLTLKRNIKEDYAYNEAIKTLRANIQFCGNNIKTIMFTSALPDEGKSDISFSLAQSLK